MLAQKRNTQTQKTVRDDQNRPTSKSNLSFTPKPKIRVASKPKPKQRATSVKTTKTKTKQVQLTKKNKKVYDEDIFGQEFDINF